MMDIAGFQVDLTLASRRRYAKRAAIVSRRERTKI